MGQSLMQVNHNSYPFSSASCDICGLRKLYTTNVVACAVKVLAIMPSMCSEVTCHNA